jgi:glycosyltransferase involved in cell wall biosynthesis
MSTLATNPLVSVLIPAYNARQWVRFSIQSALGQTYSPIEIIVADDGSTDGTAEEVRQFGDRVIFIEEGHGGANATRNLLTERAQGEWVQYLDADDYLLPNKINDQVYFLQEHDWQLDVVYSPTIVRQEETCEEWPTTITPPYDETVQFVRWSPFCTHGMLIRRSAVLRSGSWKQDQEVCQEHELIFRLMKNKAHFGVWNQPGTVYRYHSTNTTSRNDPLHTMQTRMDILEKFEDWLRREGRLSLFVRKELYAARTGAARMAWALDPSYSHELFRRASANGRYWISGKSAVPFRFQLLARLAGFRAAQRLARRLRSHAVT